MKRIRAWHVVVVWAIVYFPWLPGPLTGILPAMPYEWVLHANQAGEWALVAFSLVLLTGWVGQISLGQGAFVGIGAFVTALLATRWHLAFPLNLPFVAVISAGAAAALGMVALRVRGLYLAVATLIFAWMTDAYLFHASWLIGASGAPTIDNKVIGSPGTLTLFDFRNKRVFYLVIVAAVAAAWYCILNLRDSKTGRAFFAVRGSEMAAVSLGIDIRRYKLMAFAVSGALAGIAGNLIMTDARSATPVEFDFTTSLFFVSVAVVGGITSLGGAVASGVFFAVIYLLQQHIGLLARWLDVIRIAPLLIVLLVYPGGLGALGAAATKRARVLRQRYAARRLSRRPMPGPISDVLEALPPPPAEPDPAQPESPPPAAPPARALARLPRLPAVRRSPKVVRRSIELTTLARDAVTPTVEELVVAAPPSAEPIDWRTADVRSYDLPPDREDRPLVLSAEGVIVRFGGLTAVDNVSLAVREHEIVGLIGPNGAGKTTTFNAIAGLNEPAAGRITIFGEDATSYPVHVRAQMGVGRTFQLIQLFPQLSVFDNLMVGTHIQNETGLFAHLVVTSRAIGAERAARERVRLVIDMLGLHEVADRPIAGLPFGVLRQVEIARALVTESPLLMLDEPASGLDNAETDELAQLLYFLRAQLGVSILLIEHDVRMVTAVCDYIYVVNRGKLLAEGTAADIQRDPQVVAAYLGQPESELEPEPAPA